MASTGIVDAMQTLLLVPDGHILEWLEERRSNGVDQRDEVWDGVLHVVPPASPRHQKFEFDLEAVLHPLVVAHGLEIFHEAGVYERIGDARSFRTPDLIISDPQHVSERGIEARAEIVIEVLSPEDESRKKFEFYARCGISEFWIVHPITRAIEVYVLREGLYVEEPAGPEGAIKAPRLGLRLRLVEGPKLRIVWGDGSAEI